MRPLFGEMLSLTGHLTTRRPPFLVARSLCSSHRELPDQSKGTDSRYADQKSPLRVTVYGASYCNPCKNAYFLLNRIIFNTLTTQRGTVTRKIHGQVSVDTPNMGRAYINEQKPNLSTEWHSAGPNGTRIIEVNYVDITTAPSNVQSLYKEAIPVFCINDVEVGRLRLDSRVFRVALQQVLLKEQMVTNT